MTTPAVRPATGPSLALSYRRRTAFCTVLQGRRQARGLSLSSIADMIGLPQQAVTNIETGTDLPSLDLLFAFADALGTDAAELLHETRVLANGPSQRLRDVDADLPRPTRVLPIFARGPRGGVR